jgi:hypothetical protein
MTWGGRTGAIDAVATHHLNTFASGVARFNEILADRLGVPLLSAFDPALEACRRPLLSFKARELPPADVGALQAVLDRAEWTPDLFLHDWAGLDIEHALVRRAARVWCGNRELLEHVHGLHHDVHESFTPGLLLDQRPITPVEIMVFSFGMAHKIQAQRFRRLRELLDATGRTYALHVSSANHETASIVEAQVVFEEITAVFPERLYFLGNLSDVAVFNELRKATYFAAFFPNGVRANNTTVAAAMEQGCVVITNLDEHSPAELRHGENVIDIDRVDRLPDDPQHLARLGAAARETARRRSWEQLAWAMSAPEPALEPLTRRRRGEHQPARARAL